MYLKWLPITSDGLRFFGVQNQERVDVQLWITTMIFEFSEDIYFRTLAPFLPEDIDVASRGEG